MLYFAQGKHALGWLALMRPIVPCAQLFYVMALALTHCPLKAWAKSRVLLGLHSRDESHAAEVLEAKLRWLT